MGKTRLLIITPAETRSGAPMLMLHLVRWLLKSGRFELSAVLATGGVMEPEFAALMPTQVFKRPDPPANPLKRWLRRRPAVLRRRRAKAIARCRSVVGSWPPDLVFCNSVVSAASLDALGPYPCPVVVWVHEMDYVLSRLHDPRPSAISAVVRLGTFFLAGSEAVRQNLIARHGVRPDQSAVGHSFIPTAEFPVTREIRPEVAGLLKIPAGAAVVGFIATVEWRKGADLLVSLAREIARRPSDRPVHLVWIGGGETHIVADLRYDVAHAGLGDRVHVLGPTGRTGDWYSAFDVYGLLSREDPFPLVALEAAASGVPVVCFADAGGTPEFVETDAGLVVPYLDLSAYAEAILRLVNEPGLAGRTGATAAAKVRDRHDVDVAAPKVVALLDRLGGNR